MIIEKNFIHLVKAVVLVWLLTWIGIIIFGDTWETRGQFGDSFGAVNALFSGLAFAGIVYTILLQREDLQHQKRDSQIQRFESSLFNLINLHVNQIEKIEHYSKDYQGRLAFESFVSQIPFPTNHFDGSDTAFHQYVYAYTDYYDINKARFEFYLESLRSIYIKIRDTNWLEDGERAEYYRLLRSQVSYSEKKFLFYHSILFNKETRGDLTLMEMVQLLSLIGGLQERDLVDETHKKLIECLGKHINGRSPDERGNTYGDTPTIMVW